MNKLFLIIIAAFGSLSCDKATGDSPELTPADYSGYPLVSAVHYRNGTATVGDLIPYYYNGDYHVLYLEGDEWAHIVSTDLLNWRVLPMALLKGTSPTDPDHQGCWTGSVVEKDGVFHMFYTGKNSNDPLGEQKVMVAESRDRINWTKKPERTFYADGTHYWNKTINGSIDDKQRYHHQSFRDPHVFWNHEAKEWWMTLHAVKADGSRPVMSLHTSPDLYEWSVREPWVVYPSSISGDCPDAFYVNGKWNINCANFVYMRVDGNVTTTDPRILPFDCGDLCVPKTMYDGKRRILMGWITDYTGHTDSGDGGWGGIMSMPRELYHDASGKPYQRPVEEILAVFSERIEGVSTEVPSGTYIAAGLPVDFMFEADIPATGRSILRICQSQEDKEDGYYIEINTDKKRIYYGSPYRRFERNFTFDSAGPISVRWFVDGTVSECFVNDAYCFTMRSYDKPGSGFSFTSNDEQESMGNIKIFEKRDGIQ